MEVPPDSLGLRALYHALQVFNRRLFDPGQGPKMRQKLLRCLQADSFDITKFGGKRPPSAPLAMERDGKTVAFIADLLNQTQDRGTPLQHDRFVLAARNVNDL